MFYFHIHTTNENQIPNKSLITLLEICMYLKNKVFKQFFFFYFQVRQTFLGNLNHLQNKMFLSQPLRTAYRTIDSRTIWNIERSHPTYDVSKIFSIELGLRLRLILQDIFFRYLLVFFCFVERQVWTTYVTFGELIYTCKMIQPALFLQVQSTCTFFQVQTW